VAPDVIAIDPLDTAVPGDPSTRITLGKQITPDLRLTYTDVLGTNQGTAYQLDYRLGRNISFASEHSSTGSIGGDFRYVLEGRPPVVRAEAGPRVRLVINGARGAGALRGQIEPLWQQTLFLEDTMEDSRARIAALVQDRGWRRAKVEARIEQNDPALIQVRFDVDR